MKLPLRKTIGASLPVLLGAVACVALVAPSRAADLIDKAEPVQYVRVCTLDGHSYYYIPGYETCTKNGLALTIGTDEPRSKSLMSLEPGNGPRIQGRSGDTWPDPFISLRTDQSWGYSALVGGGHNINNAYSGDNSLLAGGNGFNACLQSGASDCGRLGDKAGYFLGWGGEVKVPLLGPGDRIGAGIRYSQNATTGFGGVLNMAGPDLFGAGNNPAVGWAPDSGSGLELTKAWSVQAGYDHQWSSSLNTSLFAGYSNLTFDGQTGSSFNAAACSSGSATGSAFSAGSSNCKANWGNVGAGLRTSWAPSSGLTLSVQTMYNNVFGGTPPAARPTDSYSLPNQGVWSSYLRLDHSLNTGE